MLTTPDRSPATIFHISPLIRITLLCLYISLTLPLPFLTQVSPSPPTISPVFISLGIGLGLVILYGALSERVILDEERIQVTYPCWIPQFFRQGWSLSWSEIKQLKMRTTGQGGLVYYLLNNAEDRAYLLPMRVAGFARLVKELEEKTGIDTTDIRPLAQPWMYFILLFFTLLLLIFDGWIIWKVVSQ